MGRATYLAVLAACVLVTLPLEFVFRARVYRRWRRYALTLLPVVVFFTVWDLWAIAQRHWSYDAGQTVGWSLPGALPVEELLFFVVIPTCVLLTFEAVRRVTGWDVDDDEPGST